MNKPVLCLLLTLFAAPLHAQTFDVLVWADEFSVDGPLDTAKWWQQHQLPNGTSWYNGEIQHYTNRDTNAFVQSGSLHLAAYKETYTNQGQTKEYTSARLNSKFAFTYGRVEIRWRRNLARPVDARPKHHRARRLLANSGLRNPALAPMRRN